MKCGCWVVGDGNNRIGLILRTNPEATIADIPKDILVISKFGEWYHEMMEWWNPCPKSFKEVMIKHPKEPSKPKNAIHGMIVSGGVKLDENRRFEIPGGLSGRMMESFLLAPMVRKMVAPKL